MSGKTKSRSKKTWSMHTDVSLIKQQHYFVKFIHVKLSVLGFFVVFFFSDIRHKLKYCMSGGEVNIFTGDMQK